MKLCGPWFRFWSVRLYTIRKLFQFHESSSQTFQVFYGHCFFLTQSLESFGNAPLNETICTWLACPLAFSWSLKLLTCHGDSTQYRWFFEGKILHPADMLKQHASCVCQECANQVKRSDITPEQFFKASETPRDSCAVFVGHFNLGICWEEEASHHRGEDLCDRSRRGDF